MEKMEALNQFLQTKIESQVLLKSKRQQLNDISRDLSASKFNRWFNTSYLRLKRLLTLLIGIALTLIAIFLFVLPTSLLEDEQVKNDLISGYRNNYKKMVGETILETIKGLASNSSQISEDQFLVQLNQAVDLTIEHKIVKHIRYLAGIILVLALVVLYVSRLTLKSRQRNTKISEAQSLVQEIIQSFNASVDEGDREIAVLKELISTRSSH